MPSRIPALAVVVAAATIAALGCGGTQKTGARRPTTGAQPPFTASSTPDGRSTLPHRIRWIARTDLPANQVREVAFLVDGRVTWREHKAPYSFADDGGYLVTSVFEPGERTFTVRVTAENGRTAVDTVRARVPAPDPLPAPLAGRWVRHVDASGAPKPGTAGNPTDTYTPSGTYTLVLSPRMMQTRFPGTYRLPASGETGEGWILDSDFTADPKLLRVQGGVQFQPFDETAPAAEGGQWCEPGGPASQYHWSVRGDTLNLRPVGGHDACAISGFIWTGTWHRRSAARRRIHRAR